MPDRPIDPAFDSVVDFARANVGDEAFVYSRPDGAPIDEWGWITQLDWFDQRDEAVTLRRQRWRLIADDEINLPDPNPTEGE